MSKPVVIAYFLIVGCLVAACIAIFFMLEQSYPEITERHTDATELLEEDGNTSPGNRTNNNSQISPALDSSPPPRSSSQIRPLEATPGERVANGIKCPCTDDCSEPNGMSDLQLPTEADCNAPSSFCKLMHGVLHGTAAGVVGAQSLVFGKASAEMITGAVTGDTEEVDIPVLTFCLVFMILTVVLQLITLNRGLRYHATLLVVPVYQTFWTLTGIIGAAVCFDEFADHTIADTLGFTAGALSMLAGLWCLVQAQETPELAHQITAKVINGVALSGVAPSAAEKKRDAEFEIQIENNHATKGG